MARIIIIPSDYPTIQEGIDACNDGDTVLVKPGIYYENIDIIENIVLASFFLTSNNSQYIENTIMDGSSSGPVVSIHSSDTSAAVVGFTIQNGRNYNGGGIYMRFGIASIRNNIIKWNESYGLL